MPASEARTMFRFFMIILDVPAEPAARLPRTAAALTAIWGVRADLQ
jgi:hypothetical protein